MSVSFRLSKYLIQFTLAYLVLKINLCQSQFIDSQYFTPALLIINGPQPDQNIDAGQNLQFSLEVTGNGKLPPASTEPGNQQATTILSLSVFLINADLNMTIFENLNVLEQERGSSVKHYDFQLPPCTPSGTYQVTYHELDRINSKSFYSIYSTNINVNNPGGDSSKTCQGATPPKDNPPDSKPPTQPFLGKGATGLDIKTDSMEVPTAAAVDVPAAQPVDVPGAKPDDAPVAEFVEGLLSHEIVNRATAADLGILQTKSEAQPSTPKALPFSQFKLDNVKKAPLAVTLVSEAPSTKEETPSAEGLAVAEALTKDSSPSSFSDGSRAKFSSLGNQKFTKSVADARQKASSTANHQGQSNDKNSDPQSHDPLSNQKNSHETQNHEQTLNPNHSQSVLSNKPSKDGRLFGVPLISSASFTNSDVTNHRTLYHLLISLCLISLLL